jgi:hypothetical protein
MKFWVTLVALTAASMPAEPQAAILASSPVLIATSAQRRTRDRLLDIMSSRTWFAESASRIPVGR